MDYYSFYRPRRDGWLSWPCWLTDSGRFAHKVVTQPAVSLVQDWESSPARTGGLTTMLRHQVGHGSTGDGFTGHGSTVHRTTGFKLVIIFRLELLLQLLRLFFSYT